LLIKAILLIVHKDLTDLVNVRFRLVGKGRVKSDTGFQDCDVIAKSGQESRGDGDGVFIEKESLEFVVGGKVEEQIIVGRPNSGSVVSNSSLIHSHHSSA